MLSEEILGSLGKKFKTEFSEMANSFELSDGTVEVGAGLGHALGNAGEKKLAKQMADFYSYASRDNYLPPVQRSFIHIGIIQKLVLIQEM